MDGDKDTVAVVVTVIGVLVFVGVLKFFGQELGVPTGRQSADSPMSQVELGKHVSRNCLPCHDLTSTRKLTRVGPPLWGIVDQPAASVSGYKYSRAQVKAGEAGVIWDEPSLDSYLNDPKEFIPGNRMAFAGLRIGPERKALIAYLKTLRDKKEGGMAPLIGNAILKLSAVEESFNGDERLKRGKSEAEKCGNCHDMGPDKKLKVGPYLMGLVGRPVGGVSEYDFSEPFKKAVKQGLKVWDVKNLDKFLADPGAVIPGTKMVFAGIKDDQRRGDLIAYLGTLK